MDIAISYQVPNLIRWAIAFIMIYIIFPVILFPNSGVSLLERLFARYVRMVAMTIIVGYILVALKLYEVISMLFVFLTFAMLIKLPGNYRKQALKEMKDNLYLRIYDFLDGLSHPYQLVRRRFTEKLITLKAQTKESFNLPNIIQAVLLVAVLAYSAYLRFDDVLRHAAPPMSDAYVTLAWMKYIDGRMLFHDGIYPQGFHIYLSVLHKFAACDALYILKYTGPFNGVLTTLGIYFLVAKITGRKLPGILSAFVFGVIGEVLPMGWERQGSPNSQEFALVFLLPAWYFAISFLQTREKRYLWTATAAFAIIGLVHTLILAFSWVGLCCIVTAFLLLKFKQSLRPAGQLIIAGIVTGVVAAVPVPVALLFGRKFHSSSVDFLTSNMQTDIPLLTLIDKLALVGFVLFFLLTVWRRKRGADLAMVLSIFFIGLASFLMYLLVGPMTGNAVLVGRLGILWSLAAAVGIGICLETLLSLIPGRQSTLKLSVASVFTLLLMGIAINYYKPSPPHPYKMQYDAEINQYLSISKEYTPSLWTMVSTIDGYDLVLGKGWSILLGDFLNWYDPQRSKLIRSVDGREELLDVPDIFIFVQKKLFMVDLKIMEPILAQRVQDYAALEQWVARYKESHDNLSIYYQDDDIVVYQIHQPRSKADAAKEIWGES